MTPDMKRLCQAAESAHADWVKGGYAVKPGEYTIEATPEAIVRAVLMELLEGDDDENMINRIDRILAEPAKA